MERAARERRLARVVAVAHNTWREAIRNRVLYILLFFALALIGSGVALATLSYVEEERILQDVGLAATRVFALTIAIFLGISLLHREVERRTVFTILSKPIGRGEFLLGKYGGLVATLLLQIAAMGLAFAAVSHAAGAALSGAHAAAFTLIAVEVAVVVAVALLFSSFTTPLLAAFFTAGVVVVGNLSRDLYDLGRHAELPAFGTATAVLYRVLPDFAAFDLGRQAVHGLAWGAADLLWPLAYGVAYSTALLIAAIWLFERRDFR